MKFSDIPSRSNGEKVTYSWWDSLKTAGLRLENLLGGSSLISETSFSIVNNQASAADVTGLVFDSTVVGSAFVQYWIKRVTTSTDAVERSEAGLLLAIYNLSSGTWSLVPIGAGPNDSGVVLTINASGQVQYTSDAISGTPSVSKMKFKAFTMGV